MVNKFVYDRHTSSVAAVSGMPSAGTPSWMLRLARATLIAAAIGASMVGMGMAATADSGIEAPEAEP